MGAGQMNLPTVILLILIAALAGAAIRYMLKHRGEGSCGSCKGCGSCSASGRCSKEKERNSGAKNETSRNDH